MKLSNQHVFIDTSFFLKALYLVRDAEITLSLLHVLHEMFQMLCKSWSLVMAFKQFHKHGKPVVRSAGLHLSKFVQIDQKGTLKVIFIVTDH